MNVTIIKTVSRKLKEFEEYEKTFTIPENVGSNEKKVLKYLKDNNLLEDEDNWEDVISGQDIISDNDEVSYFLGETTGQSKGNCRNCDHCKCDKKSDNTKLIRVVNDSEDTINVIITKVVTRKDDKNTVNFLKEFSVPASVSSGEEKILNYLKDNNYLADNNDWDIYDNGDPVIYPGDKIDYYVEEIRED